MNSANETLSSKESYVCGMKKNVDGTEKWKKGNIFVKCFSFFFLARIALNKLLFI